jgi:glycosyltransferase involved in cell wall biosynthesis
LYYPKVLVLSNNCFSLSSNNGRTLGNFFCGWPKNRVAQFYIKPEVPQEDICANYLCVSDRMVLKLLLGKKSQSNKNPPENPSEQETKPVNKNAFTMIVRYIIWKISRWRKHYGFDSFIDSFHPDMVLLQAGDTPLMYDLARSVSKKRNIPIVIYNSEDHVLRKKNYFSRDFLGVLTYPIFRHILNRSFVKTLKQSSYVIYISEKLQKAYQKLYQHNSTVIYTSTNIVSSTPRTSHDPLKISYFGNLDFNRYVSLVALANAFSEVDSRISVDVFGNITTPEIKASLESCKFIRTHGFVPYEVIRKVIDNSDILLHTESFDDMHQRINSNFFSTKIADCLASGKPFLVYAPSHIAFMEYLSEHNAAILIDNPDNLYETVYKTIKSEKFRFQYIDQALRLANENHNFDKNREKFQQILNLVFDKNANKDIC